MYIYHNEQTGVLVPFGNLRAVSNRTGIKYDTLKYHFSRLKRIEYSRAGKRIVKAEIIKS